MAKSVSVTVTGNAAPLRKELKKATQDLSGFAKAQRGFGDIAKLGYAVAGASVVRFGAQLVKAAMEDEKSQALLRDAISKTTYATDQATSSAEDFVKQLSLSSNIADDDLRPALSTLVRATGDVSRAQTLLSLSTEIATATQKDLASVSIAVAKASLGSTTALGKLGVPLSAAAKESGNFALAFEELNAQFGGSNAAALNTAAGRLANLSLRFEELKESLSREGDNSTDDTSPTFKMMEDGSDTNSREEVAQLASRQEKFIKNLENALLRIMNKTYGVCRVTGQLIPKERLRLVPHATLSIEAKNMQ